MGLFDETVSWNIIYLDFLYDVNNIGSGKYASKDEQREDQVRSSSQKAWGNGASNVEVSKPGCFAWVKPIENSVYNVLMEQTKSKSSDVKILSDYNKLSQNRKLGRMDQPGTCPVCEEVPIRPLLLSCLHPVCQVDKFWDHDDDGDDDFNNKVDYY